MIETRLYYGFIYTHSSAVKNLYGQFPAFEISIQKHTYGKHAWEHLYDYPILGIAFFYSGLGNNPALKQVYALMPFISLPLVRYENFTLAFRIAAGAGYLPKPYDSIKNRMNLAIGTHLNAAINFMFEARYRINPRLNLTGGISFQHFSNGGWKLPNYGLNLPLANLGIAYSPFTLISSGEQRYLHPEAPLPPIMKNKVEIDLGAGIGYKNRMQTLGQNFLVYHFHENTFFPVSRKSMFGFGFDLSYDPSQITALTLEGYPVTNRFQYLLPGINAAYALVISQVNILLNLGYYPGRIRPNGDIYEKLTIQYNFVEHFFTHVMLKTHGFTAAYVDWGLGYKFNFRYGKKQHKQ